MQGRTQFAPTYYCWKGMVFNMKKNMICLVTAVIILLTAFAFAAPGDSDDPLITLSYITDVLMPEIRRIINIGEATGGASDTFKVLELEQGDRLLCGDGTELILRMGKATVIATEKGGIANVTSGVDLSSGTDVPPNSLLIVPINDGRGIHATQKVIVLIKGGYVIENS